MDEKNLHNKRTGQDLMDDLQKMTDDIPVPPTLEPDAVERMLEGRAKKKRRKYVRIYGGAAAAACACVVIGLSAAYLTGHPGAGTESTMSGGAESADAGSVENADAGSVEPAAGQADELAAAEDYNEIYRYIQAQRDAEEKLAATYNDGADTGAVEDSAASQESSSAAAAGTSGKSGSYSDTNVTDRGRRRGGHRQDGRGKYLSCERRER